MRPRVRMIVINLGMRIKNRENVRTFSSARSFTEKKV